MYDHVCKYDDVSVHFLVLVIRYAAALRPAQADVPALLAWANRRRQGVELGLALKRWVLREVHLALLEVLPPHPRIQLPCGNELLFWLIPDPKPSKVH